LNSNGKYPASVALDEAVRAIVNAGIPMVVAAGNDDTVPCYAAPAGSDGIIAVAATDSSDRRASFSNHGECISLFAPGVEIFSSVPRTSSSSVPLINTGDPYVLKSGTSQAAPYVAGVIALYLEKNPQASPWQVRDALRAAASKSTVKDGRMAEALLLQSISIPEPNSPEALGQLVNLVSLYSRKLFIFVFG
jgi:subtilisin family serine protease